MELQIFIDALTQLFSPTHLAFLLLGTALGLLVGVLPGLGGVAGLSLLLSTSGATPIPTAAGCCPSCSTWIRRTHWR